MNVQEKPQTSAITKHFPDTSVSNTNVAPDKNTNTNEFILNKVEKQQTGHCQDTPISDMNVASENITNRLTLDPTLEKPIIVRMHIVPENITSTSKIILGPTETTEGGESPSDEDNTSPTNNTNQRRVTRSASKITNRRIPPVNYNESPIENDSGSASKSASRCASRSASRRAPPVNHIESPIEYDSRSASRIVNKRAPPVSYIESPIESDSPKKEESTNRRASRVVDRRTSPVSYIESPIESDSPEQEESTNKRQTRGSLKRELVGTFDRTKPIKRSKPERSELEPRKTNKPPETVWKSHYAALLEFRNKHGHCLIPKIHPENQPLSSWVFRQRAEYTKKNQNGGKSSYLTDERVAILEEQSFAWRTKCTKEQSALERKNRSGQENERWESFFSLLISYKETYGNCLVPKICRANQTLSAWVFKQRAAMKLRNEGKDNRLTDGRVIKLNAVGFVWDAKSDKEWRELDQLKKQKQADILWDQHYNSLITYKEVHGHTRVPKKHKPNQALSAWVFRQRSHHRSLLKKKPSSLTERRHKKLKQIGFQFEYWSEQKS